MASVRAGTIKGDSPEQVTDYSTRSVLADMEYRENRLGTRYFTYVDFLAFQDVLGQLSGICNLIDRACEIKKGPISPDDFKVANRVLGLGGRLSRRQVDIIFQLFDLDRDGFLSPEDAVSVCGLEHAFRLEAVEGREGKFTFAPPPNYPKTKRDDADGSDTHTATAESAKSEHIVGSILNHATQFLLSSVAGGIGIFAVYPLDLVKTRMMNQRIGVNGKRMYLQSFDCLRKTVQYEGFYGLYRGLLSPLLAVGPEKTIKFAVNDLLRGLSNRESGDQRLHWLMEVVCGGCAGACQLLVTNPLEMTKIRMQLQGETARILKEKKFAVPKSMSFSEVAADLGLSGLYRGAAACLLRDIPFGAIYFPAYAVCKDYLVNQEGASGSASASNILLAGTMAGIPASFLTTPADMVKTRLQVVPRPGEAMYSGIGDCIKTIYNTEGPTAFFKGSLFRVCRIAPQFGISLLGYEMLSELVGFKGAYATPPTNAPVDPRDYRTAFPTNAIGSKTDDIDNLVRNMGFNNAKPPSARTESYDSKR
jgi:solute carrier family 25 aspartate/glutamate transporter 12/13